MYIYHVGSTAVPGLLAKPKIDIISVVYDPLITISKLEAIGLTYRGEFNIPLHYGFTRRGPVNVNLHLYEEGHPEIELNLLFRDYLRNNPVVRDEYAKLKKQILEDPTSQEKNNPFFSSYTLKKGSFIRSILKQIGFERIRILKCSDEEEWATAKQLRQKYFFSPLGIYDPYVWTFNHPEHVHLILYRGAEMIGYAHIQLWSDHRAAIRIIVIDEDKRNNHFASQFLSIFERWLKNLGVKSIHAESKPTSINFYLKNGYVLMPFNDPNRYESESQDIAVGKML
ncbi:MAG: hypothetical protein K0S74_1761 [Chlamydiales bacterium]|nr:hypothetical protein [Chlamydiales bacterium]